MALGAKLDEGMAELTCEHGLTGGEVHLDYPSVGATENIMMAAVLAKGVTTIHNAAREPEIVDLMNFINAMGGRVRGAGSSNIVVEGVSRLQGVEYQVIPDRIVAGTYMAAAAITGGDVLLENVVYEHVFAIAAKLRDTGCRVERAGRTLRVSGLARPRAVNRLETLPYPGFPTDMQAQLMSVLCVADGTSIVVENVFENRFKHAAELNRMGADITIKDRLALVRGVPRLSGTTVCARDLRAGAALVLAGLRAEGVTTVEGVHYIDRGYERLAEDLATLGADIRRI